MLGRAACHRRAARTTWSPEMAELDRSKARFEALYARTARRLLMFLMRRTQDAETARELCAESWAAAFEAWPRCRASGPEAEEAWLFGIARRRLAGYYRSGAVEMRAIERLRWTVPNIIAAADEALERAASLALLRAQLAQALSELPERRRRAISLRIVKGLSYPEIAQAMGCSEQAARAHVSRGLRGLERVIDHGEATGLLEGL